MRLQNPFPIVFSVGDMLAGYETLLRHAESPDHIVPGHDPEVLRIYPRVSHPKIQIACLHLPPCSQEQRIEETEAAAHRRTAGSQEW